MRILLDAYQNIRNGAGYLILPKEFTCREGKFTQLKRMDHIALYQRNQAFEVIVIQDQEPFEITPGVMTDKKENFPSSTLWGVKGWSYLACDKSGAEKRFSQLVAS